MSSKIPVIDFSLFTDGDAAGRRAVAKSITAAFAAHGFVRLINHPVSSSTVSQAFRQSKLFFDLPISSKSRAPNPPDSKVNRGFSYPSPEKVSNLAATANGSNGVNGADESSKEPAQRVPDAKETYDIGSEHNAEQPNVWPPPNLVPGFRGFMTGFYWTLAGFSRELLRALALGINLEEDHFLEFYSAQDNQLRLLHYPEIEAAKLEEGRAVRVAAHRDWSAFTILFQDDCGGFEIESPTEPGKFVPVEPIEDSCLVNIGDLMARWSNDTLMSTSHRVGIPPLLQNRCAGDKRTTQSRHSIGYFVSPMPDTVIKCLPTCYDAEHPAKYAPVTQREYNVSKASMQC